MSHTTELRKLMKIFGVMKKKGLLDDLTQKTGVEFPGDVGEYFYLEFAKVSQPYSQFLRNLATHATGISAGQSQVDKLMDGSNKLTGALPDIFSARENEALFKALEFAFGHYTDILGSAKYALSRMYLISSVAAFEAYIHDVILDVFRKNPKCMRSDHKTITYKEALNFENIDQLINYLAVVEADRSTCGTVKEYLGKLGKRFGIDFDKLNFLIKQVDELVAIRNLIVHKDGVVDQKFQINFSSTGLKQGNQIVIESQNLPYISRSFRITASFIEAMLSKKFPEIATIQWNEDLDLIRDFASQLEQLESANANEFVVVIQDE